MNALVDREILDLFSDRPDLLAVADAVASTGAAARQPSARRRLVRVAIVPAVAAVAAAALLVVAAPWRSSSGVDSRLFFQRALAVIGSAPVLHVVFEYSSSNETVVDLASGAEHPIVHRNEFWYDTERGLGHGRMSVAGGAAVDSVGHVGGATSALDPFTGFATRYRDALEHGRAHIVGRTVVDGRPAVTIDFSWPGADWTETVNVDAETYVPLTIETASPRGSTVIHVRSIGSLAYRRSLFTPPKTSGGVVVGLALAEGEEITLADAARLLDGQPLGLGGAPDTVRVGHAEGTLADGREVRGSYVSLKYGDVDVSLARDEPGKAGLDSAVFPVPPAGSIAVTSGTGRSMGMLSKNGFTIRLQGPSRDAVVAAARELVPVPPSNH